jgi:hypothetical protein
LPGLASNHDPPDLCLLSSWDDRCETPASSPPLFFLKKLFNVNGKMRPVETISGMGEKGDKGE